MKNVLYIRIVTGGFSKRMSGLQGGIERQFVLAVAVQVLTSKSLINGLITGMGEVFGIMPDNPAI